MLVSYMIFHHHELLDLSVDHLGIIRTYAQFQLKGALTCFNDKDLIVQLKNLETAKDQLVALDRKKEAN